MSRPALLAVSKESDMAFELLGGGACVCLFFLLDRHFLPLRNIPLTYRLSVAKNILSPSSTGDCQVLLELTGTNSKSTINVSQHQDVFHDTQQQKSFRHAVSGGLGSLTTSTMPWRRAIPITSFLSGILPSSLHRTFFSCPPCLWCGPTKITISCHSAALSWG